MRKRKIWIGAAALAAGLALGACGGDEDPSVAADGEEASASGSSSTPEETESTDGAEDGADAEAFNDADVTFAQSMIVHHEMAIEMAQMAPTRAESQEVLDLAARIEAAQQPEIEMMTEWLESWGEEPSGMDMSGGEMGGMSEEQMAELKAASGAEFDRLFLENMIEHHGGAIEMAETEIAEGENPDAVGLAEKIVADQTAEIEEMQALLEQL